MEFEDLFKTALKENPCVNIGDETCYIHHNGEEYFLQIQNIDNLKYFFFHQSNHGQFSFSATQTSWLQPHFYIIEINELRHIDRREHTRISCGKPLEALINGDTVGYVHNLSRAGAYITTTVSIENDTIDFLLFLPDRTRVPLTAKVAEQKHKMTYETRIIFEYAEKTDKQLQEFIMQKQSSKQNYLS